MQCNAMHAIPREGIKRNLLDSLLIKLGPRGHYLTTQWVTDPVDYMRPQNTTYIPPPIRIYMKKTLAITKLQFTMYVQISLMIFLLY